MKERKMADKEKKGFRLSNFKTNMKAEQEGVWVPYENGFRILIARFGNRRCEEYLLKKGKRFLRSVKSSVSSLKDSDRDFMREVVAETILLGWENLLDDNDVEIPYSKEEARKALEIEDFFKEVIELSQQRELYALEDKKAAEGN